MFLFGGGLPSLLIASAPLLVGIALCVHVVRTNQPLYWIFVILFVPVLGSLVYFIAIVLRELEGLSYEDIAQTMDCPVGTVRSRIFRAREAIDKKLRPIFDGGLGRPEDT